MPIADCDGYEKGHFAHFYDDIIKPAIDIRRERLTNASIRLMKRSKLATIPEETKSRNLPCLRLRFRDFFVFL